MNVAIHLSNRHVHLTAEDVEILFGTGKTLTRIKDLVQPGQFACAETVTVRGPKGAIEGVRILGPERPETQCEILASDVYKLGVEGCPILESGKLQDSMPVEIAGPAGTLRKPRGLIIAKRHIHMTPEDAKAFGVTDGELVDLRVPGERGCRFENTVVRVSPRFALECHLDFDEGNACGFRPGMTGVIEKALG